MGNAREARGDQQSHRLKPARVRPIDPATRAVLPYFAIVVGVLMLAQRQSGLSASQLELSHGFGALLIIVGLIVIISRVLDPRLPR